MKRSRLTSIAAAALVIGTTLAPSAFAAQTSSYTDVTATTPGYSAILDLSNKGIMHGYSDGTFRPTDSISRGQFLAYYMLAVEGVTGVKPGANAQYYKDIAPGNWDFNYVGAAYENNWINPYWVGIFTGGNFNENYQASYGDIASFFVKSMEVAGKVTLPAGVTPLSYAYSIGLFQGTPYTPTTTAKWVTRGDAAIILENILSYTNGTLLPQGATVTVSGGTTMAPNSNEQLSVNVMAGSSTVTLPSSAMVTYAFASGSATTGFFGQQMGGTTNFIPTAPGTYTIVATVDGVQSAPFTVNVFGAPAGVTLNAANTSVPANGQSQDAITAKVVDANGNVVTSFNGTATITDSLGRLLANSASTPTATLTGVQFQSGVATINLVAPATLGSDTITVSNVTTGTTFVNNANNQPVSAQLTVSIVPQTATSIKVFASSSTLSNNAVTADQVSAQVLDQAGFPMLYNNYPVTFSVSGPGTLGYNVAEYVGNGTTGSVASTQVSSEQGQGGTIVVTASAPGLTAGSADIKSVTVGAPVALQLVPAVSGGTTFTASSGSTQLDVNVIDSNGNPTALPAGDAISATITQSGVAATGLTVSSDVNGVLTLSGTSVGTYVVTVSDSLGYLKSATADVTITNGTVANASFVTGNVYLPYGNSGVTLSAQVTDSAGNPVTQANVPVEFTVTGTVTSGVTLNNQAGIVTAYTNNQGIASVHFDAPSVAFNSATTAYTVDIVNVGGTALSMPVTDTVYETFDSVAQLNATLQDVMPGSQDLGQTAYAVAGDHVNLTVTGISQFGTPVSGGSVTITLPAGFTTQTTSGPGYSVSGSTVTATLSASGSVVVPLIAETQGYATVTAVDSQLATPITATAAMSIAQGTEAGAAVFMNGSAVTSGVVVSANTPIAFTVQAVDAGGNPVNAAVNTTVQLSDMLGTVAGNGQFRLAVNGANLAGNQVEIPQGQSSVTVYYVNSTAGTYNLSASAVNATSVVLPSSTSVGANNTVSVTGYVYTGTGSAATTLSNADVWVSTPTGTISANGVTGSGVTVVTSASGAFTFSYTAPATAASTTITAKAQNPSGSDVPSTMTVN
ncbi:S-layer homology domain-containing protein [Ferroacidibacillus organovorans]|uniref:S-layer homology domain-containing protein n=1 Tax=Ferroacidibacillus organovorans TaxID=1765683 RepID=UPI0015C41A69|nr:S-layer homology domain-containing protein [Ferroacidibacillus organovorans]